jgi:hypothetical protein
MGVTHFVPVPARQGTSVRAFCGAAVDPTTPLIDAIDPTCPNCRHLLELEASVDRALDAMTRWRDTIVARVLAAQPETKEFR